MKGFGTKLRFFIATVLALCMTVLGAVPAQAGILWGNPDAPKNALFVLDGPSWDSGDTAYNDLINAGYKVTQITSYQLDQMSVQQLEQYNYLMLGSDQPQEYYDNMENAIPNINAWVSNGGFLIFNAACEGWAGGYWSNGPGGLQNALFGNGFYNNYNYVINSSDPIMEGIPYQVWGNYASHGYFTNYPQNADILMAVNTNGTEPTAIRFQYGKGVIYAQTTTAEFYANSPGSALYPMLNNEVNYGIQVNEDIPPTGSFTWSPSQPIVNQGVTFTGSGSSPEGLQLTYSWQITGPNGFNFSESTGTNNTLSYSFSQAGSYTVSMTVNDGYGGTDTVSNTINVVAPQASVNQPGTLQRGEIAKFAITPDPMNGVQSVTGTMPSSSLDPNLTFAYDPNSQQYVAYWTVDVPDGSYNVSFQVTWSMNGNSYTQTIPMTITVQNGESYVVPDQTAVN